ncbi:TVP38/TMEM64 family protein [Bacillus sp. FJAT-27245]|uniref:TVP38/TMEM64 family protein n=1 Tax=Bacillus sp. FJAT-27245 TaxID=1684144 RepID=UPI0006A7759E|nr:VTT domain-containing protein [Bacillus sp. FJAT-27245]
MNRIVSFIVSACLIFVVLYYKEPFLDTIRTGEEIAIPVSILFIALLVFFPVVPYSLASGIVGSVFGVGFGILISVAGITLGTLLMFFLARSGFQSLAQSWIKKYPRINEYEQFFEKNAFMGILVSRLIPVIPSPILTIVCGISRVYILPFIIATLLGKLPSIIIFTFAGSLFESSKILSFAIYSFYFFIITLLVAHKISKSKSHANNLDT